MGVAKPPDYETVLAQPVAEIKLKHWEGFPAGTRILVILGEREKDKPKS